MIRKAIIVVLTLGAVLTTWLTLASYRQVTAYTWVVNAHDNLAACFSLGQVSFFHFHIVAPVPGGASSREVFAFPDDAMAAALRNLTHFRFRWRASLYPTEFHTSAVAMPFWVPFALFTAYPAIAFVRGPVRRWRRRRKGWCINCAYDLTGNVSGVCPECGKQRES